jgi:cell division septation protein DedD
MQLEAAQPGELREDDDFTTALYRAAIGPVNTGYYLPLFAAWESATRFKPHWNTAAGLWTIGWLAFRKMGGAALAYVGALVGSVLLVFGIGRLFFDISETGQLIMFFIWLLTAVLVPGLWGNVWFHSHCRKRMAVALAAHTEVAESCASLARQSSQPRRAIVVGSVQLGLLVALGLSALQFSALMQHTGFKLAGATPATPQMASGKVKEMPMAVASAPAAVVSVAEPASVPASATAPTPTAAVAAPVAVAAKVVPAAVAAPAPSPAAVAVAPVAKAMNRPASGVAASAAVAGRYGVNVGLFAKEANAKSTQAKLEAAQLPTRVDILNMQRGPRTRIRVGPFATAAQAEEAAAKIRALGLEAKTYQD